MGQRESVKDMFTRFTHITNELKSLGKEFTTEENVRKLCSHCGHTGHFRYECLSRIKALKENGNT
ncbi:hypothetical protein HAX54_007623, partial [Datura stramonium]|nr:hypothetical protein [Datura stramonium]